MLQQVTTALINSDIPGPGAEVRTWVVNCGLLPFRKNLLMKVKSFRIELPHAHLILRHFCETRLEWQVFQSQTQLKSLMVLLGRSGRVWSEGHKVWTPSLLTHGPFLIASQRCVRLVSSWWVLERRQWLSDTDKELLCKRRHWQYPTRICWSFTSPNTRVIYSEGKLLFPVLKLFLSPPH